MNVKESLLVDATTTKSYLACPRKYFYEHILNWKPQVPGIALAFGLATHAALEVAGKWQMANPKKTLPTEVIDEARNEGQRIYKQETTEQELNTEELRTPGKLDQLLCGYFSVYPYEAWKVISVEQPFNLGVTASGYTSADFNGGIIPDDGRLFSWVGKMDLIVEWPYGLSAVDHKTTSQLGPSFDDQWSPEIQMAGYIQALEIMERGTEKPRVVQGAMVNALRVVKTTPKQVSENFRRVPTTRRPDELKAHHDSLLGWVERMVDEKRYPQNTTSCSNYGGCPYLELCRRDPNPVGRANAVVPPGFKHEVWNPIEHINKQ